MAMVKKSAMAADKQGGQGGNVFRIDQCGEHVQSKPRRVYSPSQNQMDSQRAFRKSLTFCASIMTLEKAAEWMTYSDRHPKKDKKGDIWYMNPIMACLSVNIPRVRLGLEPTETPPQS